MGFTKGTIVLDRFGVGLELGCNRDFIIVHFIMCEHMVDIRGGGIVVEELKGLKVYRFAPLNDGMKDGIKISTVEALSWYHIYTWDTSW